MASQKAQIGLLCIIFFCVGFNSGYPSTFFPVFAQTHGIDLSVVGFFFSVYSLFGGITSFCGSYIVNIFGMPKTLAAGTFFAFCMNIPLGAMYYSADSWLFVPMSILSRGLVGFGASLIYITGYTYVLALPNATKYVVMFETFYGVGIAFGPVVSANLYNFFGYVTTFMVLGVLGVVLTPLTTIVVFQERGHGDHNQGHARRSVSMMEIIQFCDVAFVAWVLLIAWAGMFWIQPIWQPFIITYLNADVFRVQLAFALISVGYLVGGPSLIFAAQHLRLSQVMGIGLFLIAVSFSPMWVDNTGAEMLCSFFIGFGAAFVSMPSLQVIELLLPTHWDSHVAVSSLFSFFSYVGGFLGPTFAAITYGIEPPYAFLLISFLALLTFVAWIIRTPKHREPIKYDPIQDAGEDRLTTLLMSAGLVSANAFLAPSPFIVGVVSPMHNEIFI